MITSLIISVIMRFTNRLKNKSKAMYITIILTAVIVGGAIGGLNSNQEISANGFENAVLAANGLAESIADSFILIRPTMNILLNYSNSQGGVNFALYILESGLVYGALIFVMAKIYLEGAKRNDY
ncbi:MAG: hypothetical protein IJ867_01870 [Clostridia bacterium]|nr:hypothetical protein [Clostridia bacterium]